MDQVESVCSTINTLETNTQLLPREGIRDCLAMSPLTPLIPNDPKKLNIEARPKEIKEGDLVLRYRSPRWHLYVTTDSQIGNNVIAYTGSPTVPFRSMTPKFQYRLSRGTESSFPQKENLPYEIVTTEPLLNELPTPEQVWTTPVVISEVEESLNVNDRPYLLKAIHTLDEVEADIISENGDRALKNDYLIIGRHGTPIILSDFHQKIPAHLVQLAALGKILNFKPDIDWIDEHDDIRIKNKDQSKLGDVSTDYTWESILRSVRLLPCAEPAGYLLKSRLANLNFFEGFSYERELESEAVANAIPVFSYKNPFARRNNRPHVLSFDTDHALRYASSIKKKGDLSKTIGLDEVELNSYFDFLKKAEMTPKSYDAVCAYISPMFIDYPAAMQVVRELIDIF